MDEQELLAALTGSRDDRISAIKRLMLLSWQRGFRDSSAQWVQMLRDQSLTARDMETNAAIEHAFPPEPIQ